MRKAKAPDPRPNQTKTVLLVRGCPSSVLPLAPATPSLCLSPIDCHCLWPCVPRRPCPRCVSLARHGQG